MARVGYILTRMDGTDITTDNVVLDQVSLRNLDTKVEIGVVPLNPSHSSLRSGNNFYVQSLCLSPDGFLFAMSGWSVFKIDPNTGGLISYSTAIFPSGNPTGIYADTNFVYVSDIGVSAVEYKIHKVDRATWTLVSTTSAAVPVGWYYGIGWDGANYWNSRCHPGYPENPKAIQKRNATTLNLIQEWAYPTGYTSAYFYSCQIDSQNPTHLWLQGELGANGVIVVWNTVTQTIISEWSSPDRLRWMNQQLAPGGVEIENNSITFLTLPLIQGTTLLPVLCKNSGVNWVKVVLEFAIIDPITGLPGVYSDCTVGVGGDPFPWLLPPEETLKHVSWAAASDLAPGSYTVSLHLKLIKE